MKKLAKDLIELGYQKPELRDHIRPILNQVTAGYYSESPAIILEALGVPRPTMIDDAAAMVVWYWDQGKTSTVSLPNVAKIAGGLEALRFFEFGQALLALYKESTAPAWVKSLLEQHTKERVAELQGYVNDLQSQIDGAKKVLQTLDSEGEITKKTAPKVRESLLNYDGRRTALLDSILLDSSNFDMITDELYAMIKSKGSFLRDGKVQIKDLKSKDFKSKIFELARVKEEVSVRFARDLDQLCSKLEKAITRKALEFAVELEIDSRPGLKFTVGQDASPTIKVNSSSVTSGAALPSKAGIEDLSFFLLNLDIALIMA